MSNAPVPPAAQRTFLGHPLGLYVLFFTEMWERFCYYGMRALLMLYMINYFKWSQKDASTVYKVYTSMVYVTPILGGFLADRYLGNRWAVVIGAILMAIGQFMMAFDEYNIFFTALIFLIVGNGFFKPNMSTQVGRLYPANDGRRDAAYTIFYMGINLGAFLAPLACGWLADNTVGGYHSGFVLAGFGMLFALVIYLLGQPLIQEIDPNQPGLTPPPADTPSTPAAPPASDRPLTEAEASQTPSALGGLNALVPPLLYLLAFGLLAFAPVYYLVQPEAARASAFWDGLMLAIGGVCLGLMGYVCSDVKNGVRDRVLAILILGVFVMFFWGAFEQAGNVLNVWADKNTNRYLWKPMEAPPLYPEVAEEAPKAAGDTTEPVRPTTFERFATMFTLKPAKDDKQQTWGEYFEGFFNPVTTTSFQSINALAIFVIAPIFAWMWIALDRRKMQPSIPMKMVLGLVFMSMSVAIMIEGARQEDRVTRTGFADAVPAGVVVQDGVVGHKDKGGAFEPFHAGRLTLKDGTLTALGVVPDTERDRIVEQTAPEAFRKALDELTEKAKAIDGQGVKSASVTLAAVPAGFEMKYAGLKRSEVAWDAETRTLTAYQPLRDRERKGLLVAAGEPGFRKAIDTLYVDSGTFRVSSWWLFWSYILATLGELCLSPVGLSMVSKLAPVKYATMLMGVWLLTSAFGNFAAGAAGEVWGTVAPFTFFLYLTGIVAAAAVVLLVLVPLLNRAMHGVK